MWKSEWNQLSERIGALLDIGNFYMTSVQVWGSDYYSASNDIIANGRDIVARLERFCEAHRSVLPPPAVERLETFLRDFPQRTKGAGGIPGTQAVVAILASFRAEFQHFLSDHDAVARSLVDRGFLHLQRSIVADPRVAETWQRAFSDGELACERLGGAHLLLHGIWAFKASGTGERTDLVLGVPLHITTGVQRAAEALVLTEWKVVREPAQLEPLAEAAYNQAVRYSAGVLAGFELASRRYLIMVSSDHLAIPPARERDGKTYEFVNVAVSPRVPSSRG